MSKLTVAEPGFSEQMLQDISFKPENLDQAYTDQASLFAFYAEQSRQASKKADNFKLRVEVIESKLDKEIRNAAAAAGTKVTEKAIEQEIAGSEEYGNAVMAYNDAKATAQMLRDTLDAFKQRKDMLVQFGLSRRDEMKMSSFRINEEARSDSMKTRREALAD